MFEQSHDLFPEDSQVRNQLYARLPQPQAAPAQGPAPAPSPSPAPSFNYEQARDAWMGGPYARNESGAQQWANDYGVNYSGGDVINLPNGGGLIDILGNFKSGQNVTGTWTAAGNNGSNPNGASIGAGGMPGATGMSPGGSDFTSQIRALLLQRLGELGKPVDANDPTIANEMNVQNRLIERNRQDRRAAMAERMAASGLNSGGAGSGAMDAEIASGYEDAGQQKSAVLSSLMGRELQSRRSNLAQLLSLAVQSGDAESARALQLQMAQMDNELRRYGIGEQARQFNDQFGRQLGRDREEDFRYRFDAGF